MSKFDIYLTVSFNLCFIISTSARSFHSPRQNSYYAIFKSSTNDILIRIVCNQLIILRLVTPPLIKVVGCRNLYPESNIVHNRAQEMCPTYPPKNLCGRGGWDGKKLDADGSRV